MADKKQLTIHEMANQFIDLANMFVENNAQKVNEVGAALRYATAQLNAHEFTHFSKDPTAEKERAVQWFSDLYTQDLTEIIDEKILNQNY